MHFEKQVKEAISLLFFVGFCLIAIFVSSFFVQYIPGADVEIFNGRATLEIGLKAILAIIAFSSLVTAFPSLSFWLELYIQNSKFFKDFSSKENLGQIIRAVLVIFYAFLTYVFLAKAPNPEAVTVGVLGAPFVFLTWISDGNLFWLYSWLKGLIFLVMVASVGYIIYKGRSLLKELSDLLAEKVIPKSQDEGGDKS